MKKRILSVLITLAIVLTMMPGVAWATEDASWQALQEALAAESPTAVENLFSVDTTPDSVKITLLADFTAGEGDTTLTVSGTKTLDLNGHVINANGGNFSVIKVINGATLNLYDCNSESKAYKFTVNNDGLWEYSSKWADGDSESDTIKKVTGGCITGGISSCGGGIDVNSGIVNMYAGNIIGNKVTNDDSDGGGVAVFNSSQFNIHGGKIVGNYAKRRGGGIVCYSNNATAFNMDGGTIAYNNAKTDGGGVYLENGTFTMSGGTISYNRAINCGGGIDVLGTFNMSGGVIEYNQDVTGNSDWGGGGVAIYGGAIATLSGGEIRYNSSNKLGGGVLILGNGNKNVKMTGVSIISNTAGTNGGGVYFKDTGTVSLGGTTQITGNVTGGTINEGILSGGTINEGILSGGTANNFYLSSDKTITLGTGTGGNGVAVPTSDMSVGVTMASGGGTFINGSIEKKYFTSDNQNYYVANDENNLALKTKWSALGSALSSTGQPQGIDNLFSVESTTDPVGYKIKLLTDFVAQNGDTTLTVSGTKTLDLNGHVLDANGISTVGSVINIPNNATLTLTDTSQGKTHKFKPDETGLWVLNETDGTKSVTGGVITGGMGKNETIEEESEDGSRFLQVASGGGVFVDGGSFTMNGGNIVGNSVTNNEFDKKQGGGVYNQDKGSFTMNGGMICGNTADCGGGVCLVGIDTTFTMNGGIVCNNRADNSDGGGVSCNDGASFTMTGGTIKENKSLYGGGVSNCGNMTMTGGEIINNICIGNEAIGGGIDYYAPGTLTLGGTAKISGNTNSDGTTFDNLYLETIYEEGEEPTVINQNKITLGDGSEGKPAPTSGMSVGVTLANGTGKFTADGNGTADQAGCFFSDNNNYVVNFNNNNTADNATDDYLELAYTITYNLDGGSVSSPNPVRYTVETEAFTLTNPTKTGYTFAGWTGTGLTTATKTVMITKGSTGNREYTATWTQNTYTVTWKSQDGDTTLETDDNVGYGTKPSFDGSAPTKAADEYYTYTFAGWATEANQESGTEVASLAAVTGETTYYAAFSKTANTYNITYKDQGGADFSGTHGANYPERHTYGTATTLVNPTKTGYTFGGWFTTSDCSGSAITNLGATDYTAAITLYAKWTEATNTAYKVEHYQQNIGDVYTLSETENKTGTTGTTVNATAKTYEGFSENTTLTDRVASGSIAADGSLVLKLYYDRQSYGVSYSYGGTAPEGATTLPTNASYKYGAEVSVAADASALGYTFSGWTSNDVIISDAKFTMPAKAVTLAGSFTATTYDITYKDQKGADFSGTHESGYPTTHTYGEETTLKTATKTGYTFGGWYASADCTGDALTSLGATEYTAAIPLYAKWTENANVTISYVSANSTMGTVSPSSESIAPATGTATGSTATPNTGYEFVNWTKSESEVVSTNAAFVPAKVNNLNVAATYTANFKVSTYSITYDLAGGSVSTSNPGSYTVETETFTLTNPTKTGYTFAGWTGTGLTTATKTVTITKGSTGNREYTAIWTRRSSGGNSTPKPVVPEFANPFVDVFEKDYFYDAVLWAAENKITAGTDATHFSPNGITTRAQMISFLWRMAGSPVFEDDDIKFTDIKKTDYFYNAVVWGWNMGIVSGKSETAFAPDDNVSRGEAVTFIYRYAKVAGGDLPNPFNDVKQGQFYYYPVLWAANNGITSGTSATTFSPKDDCTRAQIVCFLYRFDLKY